MEIFHIHRQTGEDGAPGICGIGESAATDGDSLTVEFSSSNFYLFFITLDSRIGNPFIANRIIGDGIPPGVYGCINGYNVEGIEAPAQPELMNPSLSVNSYKSFVRENVPNNG